MTNNQPEQSPSRRLWLIILTRTSIAFGAILLVAIIGGALYARNFINERLAPLVESNLKQLLGKSVEIGEVERFSLNSLRFDSATIPATPDDRDRVRNVSRNNSFFARLYAIVSAKKDFS
jgi:translocation and assembly module TamB